MVMWYMPHCHSPLQAWERSQLQHERWESVSEDQITWLDRSLGLDHITYHDTIAPVLLFSCYRVNKPVWPLSWTVLILAPALRCSPSDNLYQTGIWTWELLNTFPCSWLQWNQVGGLVSCSYRSFITIFTCIIFMYFWIQIYIILIVCFLVRDPENKSIQIVNYFRQPIMSRWCIGLWHY